MSRPQRSSSRPSVGTPWSIGLWRSRIIPAQHALLAQRRGDPCHVPRHATTQHGGPLGMRVGGKYRYVWQHDGDGTKMGMGGVYREIKAPERIVNTEKFDEAWYPGEALGTLVLVEQ